MNFRTLALIGTAIAKSDAFALSPRSTTIAFSASSSRHHRHLGAASTVSSLNNSRVKSRTIRDMSTETSPEPTKAGVSSPDELRDFVSTAGSRLLVVDVRHPDSSVEPGDVKSLAVAGFPEGEYRPMAVNLPWSRDAKSMELPSVDRDTPIITHCGGGGRGQKAKEYLMKNGFTNVLNGGGPKETACWAEYGSK